MSKEGITAVAIGDLITVYPNPTNGEVRVTSNQLQVTGVEIFDVMGRKHENAKARRHEGAKDNSPPLEGWQAKPDGVVINISHLPSGLYFVQITTESGTVTKKIVKQ